MSLLAHARVGTGSRAVFLLHGFLGSARNLATLARGLTQRLPDRSAISLDLTGHGESPPLPPHPDLAVIARDVLETVRALEATAPWTLIGHSLGGRVTLRAALLEPAALAHLTLLDVTPSPRVPGGEVATIVRALAALYAEIGADDLWPAVERRRGYSIHVIRGGKSDHVSDADARRLTAAGCRVDTLEGAGHFLHVDRPEELLDRIVQGVG